MDHTGLIRQGQISFVEVAMQLIHTRKAKNTRKAYTYDLKRWLRFCENHGIDPAAVLLSDATGFRDLLLLETSAATAHRVLAALSFIYGHLLPVGGVKFNPFHGKILPRPSVSQEGKTPPVTEEDAHAVIQEAQQDPDPVRGARDTAILRLLYDTGLRRVSVSSLRRDGIRATEAILYLRTVIKGGKEVEIELPPTSREALERWLDVAPESEYVFPGRPVTAPLHPDTLNKILNARAAAAGVENVSPHSFRVSFITTAYDAGVTDREIQASVHHADPKTTQRYDRGRRGVHVASAVSKYRGEG